MHNVEILGCNFMRESFLGRYEKYRERGCPVEVCDILTLCHISSEVDTWNQRDEMIRAESY